jgi:Head fiber protein
VIQLSNVKNYTEQGGERTVINGQLEITSEGKLLFNGVELKPTTSQSDSTATDVAGLVADFNTLLSNLRTAGIIKQE